MSLVFEFYDVFSTKVWRRPCTVAGSVSNSGVVAGWDSSNNAPGCIVTGFKTMPSHWLCKLNQIYILLTSTTSQQKHSVDNRSTGAVRTNETWNALSCKWPTKSSTPNWHFLHLETLSFSVNEIRGLKCGTRICTAIGLSSRPYHWKGAGLDSMVWNQTGFPFHPQQARSS